MFWADNLYSSGNPDLKPEFSSMYEGSLSLSFTGSMISTSIFFSYYTKELEDLIVWVQRSTGKYIPENLRGGEISGTESELSISLNNEMIKLSCSFNTLSTKQFTDNKATNNKEIIYKPDQTFSTRIEYNCNDFMIASNSRYNGQMFLNEVNSIDIDPFWLHGLEASYVRSISEHLSMKFYISSDNILDEQYQVIYGYPMPGRKVETGIKLKLK